MQELLHDSHFWVSLSFVLFAIVFVKVGGKALIVKLDAKIAEVKKDIDTAAALRQEAQDLLSLYQRKQQDAEKEAQAIIGNARKHAAEILRHADAGREEILDRREQQIRDRLRRMEDAAIQEIRVYAAELAVKATADIIAGKMDDATNARLVEQSVKQLAGNLR